MSRLNRPFGLVAVVFFACSGVGRAADARVFLPKETDLVVSVNVRQALDSAVVKKYALDLIKNSLAGNKEAQQVFGALGLDPLKDFDRVTLGMGLQDFASPKAVVVAQGRFDTRKMSDVMDKLAKDQPARFAVEQASGKTVYKFTTPDQPAPMYAAPVDASTVVVGTSKDFVVAAHGAVGGTTAPAVRKEVADLLDRADQKSTLSIVAYTKGRLDAVPLPDPEMRKLLDQVLSITIDLKAEQDINLELAVGTPGEADAKKLRELIGGGLEFAKVQVKVAVANQAELQPLVDLVNSLVVAQKEKSVVITGRLPGSALEKAFGKDK